MKEIELKLISELFKDSGRSDRGLAKAVGVSQPTVTRIRTKLEKEGIIKEHSITVDFRKLGIQLIAFVFGVWDQEKYKEYTHEERVKKTTKFLSNHPNVIFASTGRGLKKERMLISLHKDYSDYSEFIKQAREEWAGLMELDSFIISLDVDIVPLAFSFRNLGKYIEKIARLA
jgi:DNA-binding Lrp family transcriptional regulator